MELSEKQQFVAVKRETLLPSFISHIAWGSANDVKSKKREEIENAHTEHLARCVLSGDFNCDSKILTMLLFVNRFIEDFGKLVQDCAHASVIIEDQIKSRNKEKEQRRKLLRMKRNVRAKLRYQKRHQNDSEINGALSSSDDENSRKQAGSSKVRLKFNDVSISLFVFIFVFWP